MDEEEAGAASQTLSPAALASVKADRLVLYDTLIAFSALDDAVGYCQGMNFVAAVLLKHMPKECVIVVMEALVRRYNFDGVYAAGLERVGLSFYQLDRLLQLHLPQLHAHFASESVAPDMYAAGWFMTLFSSMDILPYEHTCYVWDLFFVDGWKVLFRVALALLSLVADELLHADFAVIVRFLNTFPRHRVPSVPKLLRLARSFKVTNAQLFAMEKHYSSCLSPGDGPAHGGGDTPGAASEFPLSDDESYSQSRRTLVATPGGTTGSGTPKLEGGASGGKGLRGVFNRFVKKA